MGAKVASPLSQEPAELPGALLAELPGALFASKALQIDKLLPRLSHHT